MESINKIQTKNYIIHELKREILTGNLKAGEELVQESIAQLLGVSRMPVREAFQILEQEGYIVRLANRHMQVAAIKDTDILAVFRVLSSIEAQIINELFRNNYDLLVIYLAYEKYQEAINSEESETLIELEIDFHHSFSMALGSAYLIRMQETMLNGYYAFARRLVPDNDETIIDLMSAIMTALKERSQSDAEIKLKQYFLYIAEYLIERLGESAHD